MLTYHLVHSLLPHSLPQWEVLVNAQFPHGAHPQRIKGFCLAREALRRCLEQKGIFLEIEDLILNGYHEVQNINHLTFSLSHTQDWGAAVVAEKSCVKSVGIDVESMQRKVNPSIIQRITHPDDMDLENITLWSLKEACFKALMNTDQLPLPVEFSSLIVSSHGWFHPDSSIGGEWKLNEENGLIVAMAWVI